MSEAENGPKVPRPEKAAERARLAAALRENLRRRKAQSRERAAEAGTDSVPKPPAQSNEGG
jgi:hypothetical protein